MSTPETPIRPYEGAAPSPNNFADAFPELVTAAVKPRSGLRPLDQRSQAALDDLRRQMRSNPCKAATVVNLHPWPLGFNNEMYLRGIVVPACSPGQEYAHHHIRQWVAEKFPNEDATMGFRAILPIHRAAQFLRAFADPEVYGGGVLIYEGDANPGKATKVELYNPDGRPLTDNKGGYEVDDEGNKIPIVQELPLYGEFQETLRKARLRRNEFYLSKVQQADEWYKSQDPKARRLITSNYRLMAEVLCAEHIIPTIPDWNTKTSLQDAMEENLCRQCGSQVKPGAPTCAACGYVVDVVEAFARGVDIPTGRMDVATDEEYQEIEHLRKSRKQRREPEDDKKSKKPKSD